jgi:hypothetical protein
MAGRGRRWLLASSAAISLMVAACIPDAPPDGRASLAQGPPMGGAEITADGVRLLGNVPGSDGSFAFWGEIAVVNRWNDWAAPGPDDGFVVVDVSDPARPTQLSRFRCVASYADISIWEDLVFVSQDEVSAGEACDAPLARPRDPNAFAGIRVVSIADPEHPVQVAAVPTGVQDDASGRIVRGSHTHTLVPDLDHTDAAGNPFPRILVYAAHEWKPGSAPDATIVEVPLDAPSAAHVIGTIDNGTRLECHDISVFLPHDVMACAAYEAGVILFDISDPAHPVRLSRFVVPEVEANGESHHSTTFSNDGNTLVLDAEIYTDVGVTPCAGGTEKRRGGLWFYDISDPLEPQQRGFFQLPRGTSEHFCYAHESNVVPMSGPRDIVVTGWFGGGVDLVEFTDPRHPQEIASWMSSDANGEHSFAYAGYWYNGHVYAGNTALGGVDRPVTHRGFDVFTVDHPLLSKAIPQSHMNAQTQETLPS